MNRFPAHRFLAFLPLAAACFAAPVWADELIRQANNQETLTIGASYLSTGVQSADSAGAPILNRMSGHQIDLGYANTRSRSFFGWGNFYTRVELSVGLGQQDFAGDPVDPSTGATGKSNGPFNVDSESARMRVGYSAELGASRRIALTPYFGLSQYAWQRGGTTFSRTTTYYHYAGEVGVIGQATLTSKLVLGTEASVGHTLGAFQLEHDLINPRGAVTSSFSLYLDNRTAADWHQRLILRQSFLRYGEPAKSVGAFEPRRNSAFSILLECGTELDLFKALFR